MKRNRLFILMLFTFTFPFLVGCWDRLEIEERASIVGLAIDPLEDRPADNVTGPYAKSGIRGYKLTAQIAIPGRIPLGPSQGGGGPEQKPVWVVSSTGKTVDDAINNLQQELADKIFLGQLRVIIVSEKLAKSAGMHDVQDFFRRDAETRRLAWLLVSPKSAKQVMEATPKLERLPILYLVSTMDHAVKLGRLPNTFLGKYWSTLSSSGQDPVLPLVSVKSNDRIKMDGLAVFKGDRMVGTLKPLDVAVFMEITGQPNSGYALALPVPGDPKHSVIILGTSRKRTIKLRKTNGKPSFDIYTQIEANIKESTGPRGIGNRETVEQLEKEAGNILQKAQQQEIEKMQKLHADIYGFGEYVRGLYPEYWSRIRTRQKWGTEFAGLTIRSHVKVYIRRTGMSSR